MKFLSVDRIEKNQIICEDEDGEIHVVPPKNLPQNLREGSIVSLDKEGNIRLNKRKARVRKNTILNLRRKIYGEGEKAQK